MAQAPASAQTPTADWDDAQVSALVDRAIRHRQAGGTSSDIHSYQADAEGHVYFYLDREDGGDPIPMRVDQVAVSLFWQAPNITRQRIRALRKRELLPVKDFDYYIDRLTAVQNGFGDMISIGEGRDVRSVPHPLAVAASGRYHYRIAGDVTVTIPSLPNPIQVFEVDVRPRTDTLPGFVGKVFLEGRTGALTRAEFTFTPASYVDPRVDNVTVNLEHSLWEERHWLPFRQVVEVRREIPEIDFPVGSIIRATLEVGAYDFDAEIGPDILGDPRVARVAYGEADSTHFESGLLENLEAEGLSPVSMTDLRAEARQHIRSQLVSGLPQVRLFADQLSSVARANRVEGVHIGAGASFSPHPNFKIEAMGGYGLGNERPTGNVRTRWQPPTRPNTTVTLDIEARSLRDVEPGPASSGAVNSMSTLLFDQDFTDPFFSSGARLEIRRTVGRGELALAPFFERHRAAGQVWFETPIGGQGLRPVRQADEGDRVGASLAAERRWGGMEGWGAVARIEATQGWWRKEPTGSAALSLETRRSSTDLSNLLVLSLTTGTNWGQVPNQLLYHIGGRGTLPGHDFRRFGGRHFGLARLEASFEVVPGWLTARGLGGAGFANDVPATARGDWALIPTGGAKAYVGAGIGTLHGLLRVDGAWGIAAGRFELVVSVDPRLRPYL
ncbi:MAG: hypothetical protein ACR2QM_17985 [Longimicrobiales bacterium]